MQPWTYVHLYGNTNKYETQEENKKENAISLTPSNLLSTNVDESGRCYPAINLCFYSLFSVTYHLSFDQNEINFRELFGLLVDVLTFIQLVFMINSCDTPLSYLL